MAANQAGCGIEMAIGRDLNSSVHLEKNIPRGLSLLQATLDLAGIEFRTHLVDSCADL